MARSMILYLTLIVFLVEKYSHASTIHPDDQDVDVNILRNGDDPIDFKPLQQSEKRASWYEVKRGDCVPEGYCCKYHNFSAQCCSGLRCSCKRLEFFCWCTSK